MQCAAGQTAGRREQRAVAAQGRGGYLPPPHMDRSGAWGSRPAHLCSPALRPHGGPDLHAPASRGPNPRLLARPPAAPALSQMPFLPASLERRGQAPQPPNPPHPAPPACSALPETKGCLGRLRILMACALTLGNKVSVLVVCLSRCLSVYHHLPSSLV